MRNLAEIFDRLIAATLINKIEFLGILAFCLALGIILMAARKRRSRHPKSTA